MRLKIWLMAAILSLLPVSINEAQPASQSLPNNKLSAKVALAALKTEDDKYWLQAKEYVYKSVPELLAQRRSELQRGITRDKLFHGNLALRQVALTFDDGPHPKYTPKLLKILKQYDVKATFFVVGELAEKHPELIRAEIAAGNSVGNHTYHHVNLTKIPSGYVATEIKACNEVLFNITHKPVHLFRPPGGDYNDQVAQVAEALNCNIILWSDDPGDYASPGTKVIEKRLLNSVGNGGIILIHDGIQQTIDALPIVIRTLKQRGYEFVTIDQMLKNK